MSRPWMASTFSAVTSKSRQFDKSIFAFAGVLPVTAEVAEERHVIAPPTFTLAIFTPLWKTMNLSSFCMFNHSASTELGSVIVNSMRT